MTNNDTESDTEQNRPSGPSQFITDAYSLRSKEDVLGFYRKWAADYDNQMLGQGYLSPQAVAALLAAFLNADQPEILDAGCGTGLTGEHVHSMVPGLLDGIDISGEMIAVARSREIYRRLLVGDLNMPLPFDNHSYDAVVSSGTFTHGHVGAAPLRELVRVLRPGGVLACTIHFDLWHSHGFDRTIADMLADGSIRCLSLSEGPYYDGQNNEGWFCVYQKC